MANKRGRGNAGWLRQLKLSLDEDSGAGYLKLEESLLEEVFRDGVRSDAFRLMVRHFGQNPPPLEWMRQWWKRPLGEGWPEGGIPIGAPHGSTMLEGGGSI